MAHSGKRRGITAKRIVLIEDDVDLRTVLFDVLTLEGAQVVTFPDGASAIAGLQEDPDMVILDLNLPDMPGWEVLEALKRLDPVSPVIILTASADEANRRRAQELGALHYIVKPVSPSELVRLIQSYLGPLGDLDT